MPRILCEHTTRFATGQDTTLQEACSKPAKLQVAAVDGHWFHRGFFCMPAHARPFAEHLKRIGYESTTDRLDG